MEYRLMDKVRARPLYVPRRTDPSRWFILQPNLAGIGVNVNAVIDDAVALRQRKRDDQDGPGGQDGGR